MTGKWEQFKKDFHDGYTRSPIDLKTVNKGDADIVGDWNRVDAGPVLINGVTIHELLRQDRGLNEAPKSGALFKNEDELKAFFKKHLLKDMVVSDREKDLMLGQMMKFLHQGALQTPVSSSATMVVAKKTGKDIAPSDARDIKNEEGEIVKDEKGVVIKGQVRELHFCAVSTGFTVSEKLTQNMMSYTINSANAGKLIFPDDSKTKPYIYKAEALISVDFSKDVSSPKIQIEENTIDFGNKQIENVLDDRNFLQKFIDGILLALGFRTIDKVAKMVEGRAKDNGEKQPNPEEGVAAPLMR